MTCKCEWVKQSDRPYFSLQGPGSKYWIGYHPYQISCEREVFAFVEQMDKHKFCNWCGREVDFEG